MTETKDLYTAEWLADNCDLTMPFEKAVSVRLRELIEQRNQLAIRVEELEAQLYAIGAGGVAGELK